MPRSRIRFGDLHKIFRNGDSNLLNGIGALCILFQDFRHEYGALVKFLPLVGADQPFDAHPILYYIRRSLVTLNEVKDRLNAINGDDEYRAYAGLMEERHRDNFTKAQRFLNKNSVLNNFRNYMGAHIDPEKVVQSSIRYMGPGAMGTIGWETDATTDFALKLDFATYILEGGIASNLPGGAETLGIELAKFLTVMSEAYRHLANATFTLVYVFLWDKFGQ